MNDRPESRWKVAGRYALQYGTWVIGIGVAFGTAALMRTAVLAIMVRLTEAGYWGGVRVSLADRVYIVIAGVVLTIHLVFTEHFLRRGRETGKLLQRCERVIGIELLVLGVVLLTLAVLDGLLSGGGWAAGGAAASLVTGLLLVGRSSRPQA